MVRKFFVGVALLALGAPSGLAVYGIGVNASSSDSFFTTVGNVGGGTGTVIAPNWVLTARHVSGNFNLNGMNRVVAARFEHPTADLALLRFNTAFTSWTPILTTGSLGMDTTIVGFGRSADPRANGTGYTDFNIGFGTRRAITNHVGRVQNLTINYGGTIGTLNFRHIICDLDTHLTATPSPYNQDLLGDGGATPNEGGVQPGDSGGPWMVNVGGSWRVAGITTVKVRAQPPPAGTENDPDPFLAFGISGSAGADLSSPEMRDWIQSTVPEPGTVAVLGIGIAAMLRRRRK